MDRASIGDKTWNYYAGLKLRIEKVLDIYGKLSKAHDQGDERVIIECRKDTSLAMLDVKNEVAGLEEYQL